MTDDFCGLRGEIIALRHEQNARDGEGNDEDEQKHGERAARLDLVLAVLAGEHVAAAAFAVGADAAMLALRVATLHDERLDLLDDDVGALHDCSKVRIELELEHGLALCIVVPVDEASRQTELARLVAEVPAAREALRVDAFRQERVEVHSVDTDPDRAVAILRRPLDPPLELVDAALHR